MPESSELNRFLCWDSSRISSSDSLQIRMHHPVKQNVALRCDSEWEGNCTGYASCIFWNGQYHLYYRGCDYYYMADGSVRSNGPGAICLAVSSDGITFTKPNLGLYDWNGSKENNIIFTKDTFTDNFSVFLDKNPDVSADERFKALSQSSKLRDSLDYYASADGYHFRFMRTMPFRGSFDSFNVVFWDPVRSRYFLYYRTFHPSDKNRVWAFTGLETPKEDLIRGICVATSEDFQNWDCHGPIAYCDDFSDVQMYTNQIAPYFRAPKMLLGLPTRYYDRVDDPVAFSSMPLADKREVITRLFDREGTALTDVAIMTSYDGFLFDRRTEAFMTPGPEDDCNWWYGNCYTSYGPYLTQSESPKKPPEISFLCGDNYRIKPVEFWRYTIRLDGFFSWYADLSGGYAVTEPVEITGGTMTLNLASSALGGVRVTLLDENGDPIPGYRSHLLFGDNIAKPAVFDSDLSRLSGQRVKIRFDLYDAHLYSFTFD
ncbi:MAG: hypothetical protein IJR83_06580 [Clostridia bacterium]|nr:hypothetical protein [Clostridia bacterium]